MNYNKIRATTPDKVYGKFVKYRQGDCLSVDCGDGKFLAVLISRKFNKYYDFTLLEFYEERKPQLSDFINGRFWGTRFGSWEDLTYAVDIKMIECKYVDNNLAIEKVVSVQLISGLSNNEAYLNNVEELLAYYLEQLPIRIQKTLNAEKFPDLAFVSEHLVEMKFIIADEQVQ